MRKAKKRTSFHGKKKADTPSIQKAKAKALPSTVKVVSTISSSTKEVSPATRGKRDYTHLFKGIRNLFPLHHHEVYEQLKHWWQNLTQLVYKLRCKERELAKVLREYLKTLIGSTLLLLFFTLVGLNSPASYPPLFTIIHLHQTLSIIVILLLTLYLLRVLLVGPKSEQEKSKELDQSRKRYVHPLLIMNVISYSGSILLLFILVLLLLRPEWCPSAVCPPPQRILITHPQSIHDENLEVYPIEVQSAFYVIPGDPAHYKPSTLPMSISALHTDGKDSMSLYHLIIGLDSLQQGRFGMIIEEVNLVIQKEAPIPHPVNVWNYIPPVDYENENQYRALYLGQETGAVIPTDYLRFQYGFVQLKPGETDQIDIHVISRVEANIWFSVQIVYRIDNESILHTLKLPEVFEVMFVNKSDWHLYHL